MIFLILIVGLTIHGALYTAVVQLTGVDKLLYEAAKIKVDNYFKKRRLIIKALVRGADVKKVQNKFDYDHDPLMYDVVRFNDEDLLRQLLIRKGALAAVMCSGRPLLYYVTKLSIAKLLIENGAHNHLTEQEKQEVLEHALQLDRGGVLLKFYQAAFDGTNRYRETMLAMKSEPDRPTSLISPFLGIDYQYSPVPRELSNLDIW